MEKTKVALHVLINWELMKLNVKYTQLLNPFGLLFGFSFVFGETTSLAQAGLELVALPILALNPQSSGIGPQSAGIFRQKNWPILQ